MTLVSVPRYDSNRLIERGGRAVVVGAGMAGLLAARVLADAFDEVTVLERDPAPDEPVARRGVPQGRHIHVMLEAGRATLEDLFPGYRRDLLSAGGLEIDGACDVNFYTEGDFLADSPHRLPQYAATRPLYEQLARRHVRGRRADAGRPGTTHPLRTGGDGWIRRDPPGNGAHLRPYIGFAKIATVAEEMENPGRNLPLSVIDSVTITTVVYAIVMVTILVLIPWQDVAGNNTVVADAGGLLFGTAGFSVMTVGGLLATASSTNAAVLAASRINLAMARDEIVSDWISVQSESRESPTRAVVLTGAFILAFIADGDIESLAKAGSVLHLILYGLLNGPLIVFRTANLPEDEYDPDFTVPLYPVVPIVGALLSFGLIAFMVPVGITLGIAFIAISIVWYFVYTRQRFHEDETGILQKHVLD